MSAFTIKLKDVVPLLGGTIDFSTGMPIAENVDIGLNTYPVPDEVRRKDLNSKILNRFYNREIGQESIEMFRFAMRRKMHEIMPYYNQLYASTLIEYAALDTVNLTTDSEGTLIQDTTASGESAATSNATGVSRSVNSDTPQSALREDGEYATSSTDSNSVSENNSNATQASLDSSNTANTGLTHMTGYQGIASDLIVRYRDSLINVDLQILGELEQDMFMLVWDTSDSHSEGYTI